MDFAEQENCCLFFPFSTAWFLLLAIASVDNLRRQKRIGAGIPILKLCHESDSPMSLRTERSRDTDPPGFPFHLEAMVWLRCEAGNLISLHACSNFPALVIRWELPVLLPSYVPFLISLLHPTTVDSLEISKVREPPSCQPANPTQ